MFLKEISTFLIQGGRKLILDGGAQVNTKKFISKNLPAFSNFYSTKTPKDGGT